MATNKTTTSFTTQVVLTKDSLINEDGLSTASTLKTLIKNGIKVEKLIPWNGKSEDYMKKTEGVHKKYAGQKLSSFRLKIQDNDVFICVKEFDSNKYYTIGKIPKNSLDQVRMCFKNCSSYDGAITIIGGSVKITTGGECRSIKNGDFGLNMEMTFYFRNTLSNSGFRFPEKFPLQPIASINDYVVFDLEMLNGIGMYSEIIEIGAIKYINNKEIGRFQTYIKPRQGHIPSIITELTGITDELVEDASTIDIMLPLFLKFIGNLPLIGHDVANYDIRMIKREMAKLNLGFLSNQSLDTLTMARQLYELPNHKLETIKEYFKMDVNSHEAINDCVVSNKIFQDFKQATLEEK